MAEIKDPTITRARQVLCDRLEMDEEDMQTVDLADKEMDEEDILAICKSLHYNTNVQLLDLSGNELSDEAAEAIVGVLEENPNIWIRLTFHTGDGVSDKTQAAIDGFMAGRLHPEVKLFAPALIADQETLTEVHISGVGLTDLDAKELTTALKNNSHVTSIDLQKNCIGDVGAKAMAGLLDKDRIKSVHLGANQIGKAGMDALVEAFESASSTLLELRELDIRENPGYGEVQHKNFLRSENGSTVAYYLAFDQ